MKRYFGVILAAAFVSGGIYWAYTKFNDKTKDAAREVALSKLKLDYVERQAWIKVNPDEKSYRSEVNDFFRTYFKEVNEHLNKFGGNRNFDEYLTELDTRAAKPGAKTDKLDDKKATYEYVRKAFDLFKSGNYSPQYTATDKGIRFDIVTSPVVDGGENKIRYQLVIWGVPRRETIDDRGVKKVSSDAKFSVHWKLTDDKDKLLGEMDAAGDPASRIDWPERYVKFFPPDLILGHYDVDLLPSEVKTEDKGKPSEVKKVEITFTVGTRSAQGQDITATFKWALDVPAEWKLKTGQQWKGATESVRSEEEIDPKKQARK